MVYTMVSLMEHWQYQSTSQMAILSTIHVPCLVYLSEADDPGDVETRGWLSAIPNATFLPISGNHVSVSPEAEVSIVRQFLDCVEARSTR